MKNLLSLLLLCFSVRAQVPTPQPEPTATSYDTSVLNLLPSYNLASFKAVTGTDAPEFDVTKAPKFWFDSTKSCSVPSVAYKSQAGTNLVPFSVTGCDAAAVNIPPASQPQMPAVLNVVDDGVRYTSLADLDVYLQNQVYLAESLMLTNGGSPASTGQAVVVTPIDPTKAAGTIAGWANYICQFQTFNDLHFHGGVDPACNNAAAKAAAIAKYSAAIQDWATQAAKVQDLMGIVPGTPCKFCDAVAKAPVPMPVRDLFPDERLQVASMMGGVLVVRTPAVGPAPQAPVQSPGGGFLDSDRAMLQQVLQILKGITGQ